MSLGPPDPALSSGEVRPTRRRFLAAVGASSAAVGSAGCAGLRRRIRAPATDWRTRVASGDRLASPLALADGRLLAMADHGLDAVDADDGDHLWKGRYFERATTGPVVSDDVAVVADRRRVGYRPDGTEAWAVDADRGFRPHAALDGVVVGGHNREDAGVLAVDAGDGDVRWGVTPDGWPTAGGDYAAYDTVAVDGGVVAAHFGGPLAGLEADGSVRWVADDGWDAHGPGTPSLATDGSTVVAASGAVAAFDPATGDRLWRRRLPDFATGVTAADGSAYVTVEGRTPKVDSWDAPGGVLAYDLADGRERWRARLPAPAAPPAVDGGEAVVGTEAGALAGLDAESGSRRWILPVGDRVVTAPLSDADRTYVGVDRGGSAEVVAVGR